MHSNSRYFQHLTEGSVRILDGNDRIYFSELHQDFSRNAFRNVSIKFPLKGIVNYKTENADVKLAPDSFLLSCKQPGIVFVDSESLIQTICIDIKQETISEAFTLLSSPDINLDNFQAAHFVSPDFFENIYRIDNSALSQSLLRLAELLQKKETDQFSEETFLHLAEKVIVQEFSNFQALQNLESRKLSTKKEVLKRVLMGKDFMDEFYPRNPEISEIIKISKLSQFHFFRSFKQAFGYTPYQYMMEKRLKLAAGLMQSDIPLSLVAIRCGFPDLFTFSKAFKRRYTCSPSAWRKDNLLLPELL